MGVTDHNYYKIFIKYLTNQTRNMTKHEISNVKNTYNNIKLYKNNDADIDLLFYRLKTRFQELYTKRHHNNKQHQTTTNINDISKTRV